MYYIKGIMYYIKGIMYSCLACGIRTFESRQGYTDLYVLYASGAQGVLLCEEWGVTASQLDLPSLIPLSVAGCGRLKLGPPIGLLR